MLFNRSLYFSFLLPLIFVQGISFAQKKDSSAPKPVVVTQVQIQTESPVFKGNGLLAPIEKALPSVDVAGRVAKIYKRAGDFVKKGEKLAELINTDLKLNLLVLRAKFKESEAELASTKRKVSRMKALFDQKLASEEEFENEVASLEVMKAKKASVKAQVNRLATQLKKMAVLAPISGQIIKADLEIGQWITPNKPIFEIFNYERFELMVGIPGRFLNKISKGANVPISVPEIGKNLTGKIKAIVRHVDSASGNFQLRIEVNNKDQSALSGLLAKAEIPVGQEEIIKTLPRDAIVRRKGKTSVVVIRNGKAQIIPILVKGNLENNKVIISGEIKQGEKVVVRGNERLFSGTTVIVKGSL